MQEKMGISYFVYLQLAKLLGFVNRKTYNLTNQCCLLQLSQMLRRSNVATLDVTPQQCSYTLDATPQQCRKTRCYVNEATPSAMPQQCSYSGCYAIAMNLLWLLRHSNVALWLLRHSSAAKLAATAQPGYCLKTLQLIYVTCLQIRVLLYIFMISAIFIKIDDTYLPNHNRQVPIQVINFIVRSP